MNKILYLEQKFCSSPDKIVPQLIYLIEPFSRNAGIFLNSSSAETLEIESGEANELQYMCMSSMIIMTITVYMHLYHWLKYRSMQYKHMHVLLLMDNYIQCSSILLMLRIYYTLVQYTCT